jgi:hypothetical protein
MHTAFKWQQQQVLETHLREGDNDYSIVEMRQTKNYKLKSCIFWNIMPYPVKVNQHFGEIYRLHPQGKKQQETSML